MTPVLPKELTKEETNSSKGLNEGRWLSVQEKK